MRVALISCVESGRRALETLIGLGADIRAIVTLQDDLVAHASGGVQLSPLAEMCGIPCLKIRNINDAGSVGFLRQLCPDLIFVIGWSQLLGREVLAIPPGGVIGFHPTLLPKGRGRAPIPWTLIHGIQRSGATLFYLDEGVDSGDIIGQREFDIGIEDTAEIVYQKAVAILVELLHTYFPLLMQGRASRTPQDHHRATYWSQRRPKDGWIQWKRPRLDVYNWVRGLTHPYPGAFTSFEGRKLIIWSAALGPSTDDRQTPGNVSKLIEGKGFMVATGDGELLVTRAQFEAGVEESAWTLVERHSIVPGTQLGGEVL